MHIQKNILFEEKDLLLCIFKIMIKDIMLLCLLVDVVINLIKVINRLPICIKEVHNFQVEKGLKIKVNLIILFNMERLIWVYKNQILT